MIGLFNDCFPPIMDGVSVTTSNYAYWLNKKRGDVCVVTPKSDYIRDKDDYSYPVFDYFSFPIPMRKPYRCGMPQLDWSFHHKINRIPFELVHAHCPFSSGNLALNISKSSHVPFVATFHSKYRYDFERIIPNSTIVNRIIKNIVEFYEKADEVWIPQAAVEETLREYGYKGRVEVVDNGNDFSEFPYSRKIKQQAKHRIGVKEGIPVLLFVGQHIWEKNVRLIIHSLSQLKDVKFKMIFVGTGYAASEMEQLSKDLGLIDLSDERKSKVKFVGVINDRNILKDYYTAADLFLFPSLYDNAPLVVREAAALHTPSLLIEGSTSSEIVNDGINGFLSKNNQIDYSHKISSLLSMPDKIEKVGDFASTQLSRSWRDIAEDVNDRYIHIIKRYGLN